MHYVVTGLMSHAQDQALPIGYGQTISAPHMYVKWVMCWYLFPSGLSKGELFLILAAHTGTQLLLNCWSNTCNQALRCLMWAQVCSTAMSIDSCFDLPSSSSPARIPPIHPQCEVHACLSTGSGYLSACMGHMVGSKGHVLGIERVPQLAQRSISSLRRAAPELCAPRTVLCPLGQAALLLCCCCTTCGQGEMWCCVRQVREWHSHPQGRQRSGRPCP